MFAGDSGWSAATDSEVSSIKEQIAEHQDQLNSMDVVASAKVPTNLPNKDAAAKWAEERLKPTGYRVDRKGYGEIYFSKKDMDRGLRYADTAEEKAALAVLPQVLKRGIEVGNHGKHKGREKQTITFAAPVELNGTRGNMAVVVNLHGNHYYAHRIVLPDGTAFRFGEMQNDAAQELSRGVTVSGSLADTTSAASEINISQNTPGRKGGRKFSLPENEAQDNLPLNTKAEDQRNKVERRLVATVGKLLNVPASAQRGPLRDIAREISTEMLNTGTVSRETTDRLFDRAWDEGVVVAREFAEENGELERYLRGTRFVIAPEDAVNNEQGSGHNREEAVPPLPNYFFFAFTFPRGLALAATRRASLSMWV